MPGGQSAHLKIYLKKKQHEDDDDASLSIGILSLGMPELCTYVASRTLHYITVRGCMKQHVVYINM